jgi:hypothetical protein
MVGIATILMSIVWASDGAPTELPHLSFDFFDPGTDKQIEPTDGWIVAKRDQPIHFRAQLEVESVEAPYEFLIFRDSTAPDPLLGGHKPPQNLWISAFRLDEGKKNRARVPILTHCSGGGKSLSTYYSMLSLQVLYFEPERTKRVESLIDQVMEASSGSDTDEGNGRVREMRRRQIYRQTVDMPPGDYELEAVYAPYAPGSWQGKLVATTRVRITAEDDPLNRELEVGKE